MKMNAADDLGAGHGRVAYVGADPGRPLHPGRDRQRECQNVAAEAERVCAGHGILDQSVGMLHQ
jgi:hypothetical protein